MKKIYIVSLDDDVPLSDKLLDKIKVLCYLVYDSIRGLEYEEYSKILDNEDNIIYNELLEINKDNTYTYKFKHDDYETGRYEPFMINDTSFGFTINDNKLSETELYNIIDSNKTIALINCNFKVDSVTYLEDINHKNRLLALKHLLANKEKNKKEKVKIKTRSLLTLLGASIK